MRFGDHLKLKRLRQVNLNPSFVSLWDNRAGSAADTLILVRADREAQRPGWMVLNVDGLNQKIHWI